MSPESAEAARPDLNQLQTILGVTFRDAELLRQALTHRSYLNENPGSVSDDNQRLEFLGDAVLDFIVGEHLYKRFPEMREGQLTSLRAALVRTEALAELAGKIGLGRHLFLGRGEEEAGGRQRPSVLADAFEALLGAISLEAGLETARAFLEPLIATEIEEVVAEGRDRDFKSILQEEAQARFQVTPVYRTVSEIGPDHAKEFSVEVWIGQEVYGRGAGSSKQAAEQEAARQALSLLTTRNLPGVSAEVF